MFLINQKKSRGFTLIELLVVIAIIGVLASVVLASLNTARTKARDARRVSEIREIQKALELAYDEDGAYPISAWVCSHHSNWESSVLATALEPYLPTMPTDPVNMTDGGSPWGSANGTSRLNYCYYGRSYGGPGEWYMLVFRVEQQNIALDAQDGVTACNGTNFNYGGEDGHIITMGGSC